MTTYLATVHLLFDLDESDDSEAAIPDALNSILTEDMRKYGRADSCLIDWAFTHGDALQSIRAVEVPAEYEPDESPFPIPADDGWTAAELQRVRDRANNLECLLAQAVEDWPQFDSDDDVSGADLAEWFGQFRQRAKAAIDA